MMENYKHTTVLLDEAVNGLNIRPDGIYIDGTFGRGGHSRLILSQLGEEGVCWRSIATRRLSPLRRLLMIRASPSSTDLSLRWANMLPSAILSARSTAFSSILASLHRNLMMLNGFSFMRDGPLDMRMDPTRGQSAAEWLQTAEEADIAWVLKTYGEERFAKRIARAIVERNREQPMTRTKELAEVVAAATPVNKFKHPATRTFQAVRIWVNSELEEIEQALKSSLNVLAPGAAFDHQLPLT